jgi:hypothetical protein
VFLQQGAGWTLQSQTSRQTTIFAQKLTMNKQAKQALKLVSYT